jgi:hypothetical protein
MTLPYRPQLEPLEDRSLLAIAFGPPINYTVGTTPSAAITADLNGDGFPDLVVPNAGSGNISVLLGRRNGIFKPQVNYAAGTGPTSAIVADFNGDSKLDVAVTNPASNAINVLLGKGSGKFNAPIPTTSLANPVALVAGNFNGGSLDLAVVNGGPANQVTILTGQGNGMFLAGTPIAVGSDPSAIAAGNIDSDGDVDLVVANAGDGDVSLLFGDGSGGFTVGNMTLQGFSSPSAVALRKLDAGATLDLVVVNAGNAAVSVLPGVGDGTFGALTDYAVADSPQSVTIRDINNDNDLDLLVNNLESDSASLLIGLGNGAFMAAQNIDAGTMPAGTLAVDDFNADGLIDFAAVNKDLTNISVVFQNNSLIVVGTDEGVPGQVQVLDPFTGAIKFTITPYGSSFTGGVRVAIAPVNKDTVPDIIVGPGPGTPPLIQVYNGRNGKQLSGAIGSFYAFEKTFMGGVFVTTGDVDGNKVDDIVIGSGPGRVGQVNVFVNGSATLEGSFNPFGSNYTKGVSVAVGNVNGDGSVDIVCGTGPGVQAEVATFNGITFNQLNSFNPYGSFAGGLFVGVADITGDGMAEILIGPGAGMQPLVKVFNGATGTELTSFLAYPDTFLGGVRVSGFEIQRTGKSLIITGPGAGLAPMVQTLAFDTTLGQLYVAASIMPFPVDFLGGVWVGSRR